MFTICKKKFIHSLGIHTCTQHDQMSICHLFTQLERYPVCAHWVVCVPWVRVLQTNTACKWGGSCFNGWPKFYYEKVLAITSPPWSQLVIFLMSTASLSQTFTVLKCEILSISGISIQYKHEGSFILPISLYNLQDRN